MKAWLFDEALFDSESATAVKGQTVSSNEPTPCSDTVPCLTGSRSFFVALLLYFFAVLHLHLITTSNSTIQL